MTFRAIAVIPARGGSKRIPRKNARMFAGKPMIAHSIAAALNSEAIEEVLVSTDDQEIREISLKHGALVPFIRPSELSDDQTSLMEVMAHAARWAKRQSSSTRYICCLFATAPLVSAKDIAAGLDLIQSGSWSYVFGATTYAYPIFRSFELLPSGGLQMFFPGHFKTRSQDLPEAIHDAGQFCWGHVDAWESQRATLDQWSTIVKIPRWRVQDIDTEEDWTQAELLVRALSGRNEW